MTAPCAPWSADANPPFRVGSMPETYRRRERADFCAFGRVGSIVAQFPRVCARMRMCAREIVHICFRPFRPFRIDHSNHSNRMAYANRLTGKVEHQCFRPGSISTGWPVPGVAFGNEGGRSKVGDAATPCTASCLIRRFFSSLCVFWSLSVKARPVSIAETHGFLPLFEGMGWMICALVAYFFSRAPFQRLWCHRSRSPD